MNYRDSVFWTALTLIGVAGCSRSDRPATSPSASTTLTIGFGSTTGTRIQQVADLITQEGLVNLTTDGRVIPWLAESWETSSDGLSWRFRLRPNVVFHDGTSLTAAVVRDALVRQLPDSLGPSFEDVGEIRAESRTDLVIELKKRSRFLLEALNLLLRSPTGGVGTGPFFEAERKNNFAEFRANVKYYGGRPSIDRILLQPYSSVRSAWADMLRTRVDMVYEISPDTMDLMKPARDTRVFTFHRPYSYVMVFNTRKSYLRDPAFRRALNAAIDREAFVRNALDGQGRPADVPVWPDHWASDQSLPGFQFAPSTIASQLKAPALTLLYSDSSHERMALFVQQQLQAVGIPLRLELSSVSEALTRVGNGNFDAWLADMGLGPSFLRQYLFWHSGSPYNWGGYSNRRVDAALDNIRQARDDTDYKAGVAEFEKAMIEDPPGLFLAWSERARAVSTRFDVHPEPGRDVLTTLRLWRPVAAAAAPSN